jgi:hypothetical protein
MNKTIFVALVASLALASCRCKTGGWCSPAHKSDSAKAVGDSSRTSAPAATLVLAPTTDQIAAAHRVGNKSCPTDGEALGSMGKPVPLIYKGELVELCCKGCRKEFATDPDKYLAIAKADTASN